MITFEDCIGLCELNEEEVAAIARHEHIPALAAAELGHYLLEAPGGQHRISEMIRDDIREALEQHDVVQAAKLKLVLKYFLLMHPDEDAAATLSAASISARRPSSPSCAWPAAA